MIRLLKKQHVDLNEDLLERYKIRKDEIIRGAICPKCRFILKWQSGSWFCAKCREYSKENHIQALRDYALLISTQISNRELRDYLYISSPSAAKRLLIGMKIPFSGANKTRVYYLNFEEF